MIQDILTKNITVVVRQVPLDHVFHIQAYSMYRYAQQQDDSRGLIARTLEYPEYLLFALQSTYLCRLNMVQTESYAKKTTRKISKFLEDKPVYHKPMIEPLLVPVEVYDKSYKLCISSGLCLEQVLLFAVYELCRVKNPRSTWYNPEVYTHHQTCWMNAPRNHVPYTDSELSLARSGRLLRNLRYQEKVLHERWASVGYPDLERMKDLCFDLREVERQQKIIRKLVDKVREEE